MCRVVTDVDFNKCDKTEIRKYQYQLVPVHCGIQLLLLVRTHHCTQIISFSLTCLMWFLASAGLRDRGGLSAAVLRDGSVGPVL